MVPCALEQVRVGWLYVPCVVHRSEQCTMTMCAVCIITGQSRMTTCALWYTGQHSVLWLCVPCALEQVRSLKYDDGSEQDVITYVLWQLVVSPAYGDFCVMTGHSTYNEFFCTMTRQSSLLLLCYDRSEQLMMTFMLRQVRAAYDEFVPWQVRASYDDLCAMIGQSTL